MEKDNTWTNKGKNYADDRIPTIEEIRKLLQHPDRRIKAVHLNRNFNTHEISWSLRMIFE